MRLLVDTQLLLWSTVMPRRLSERARAALEDGGNALSFSVVALWEVVIKNARGRPNFRFEARELRRQLLTNGFAELGVTAAHVLAIGDLPPLHRDPFDRLLVAQARSEGMVLLTVDAALGRYGDGVEVV